MEEPVRLIQHYVDGAGEWRWKALAGNNRIVADSGEGYENLNDCLEEARKIFPEVEFRIYSGEDQDASENEKGKDTGE